MRIYVVLIEVGFGAGGASVVFGVTLLCIDGCEIAVRVVLDLLC